MGSDARPTYDSFRFAENEGEDALETAMSKFDSYFVPKRNLVHERAVFNKRFCCRAEVGKPSYGNCMS